MPAVFGLFDAFSVVTGAVALALVSPGAVTTMVVPLVIMVAGASFVRLGLGGTEASFGFGVGDASALAFALGFDPDPDGEDSEESPIWATSRLVPVRYTVQKFVPPPTDNVVSYVNKAYNEESTYTFLYRIQSMGCRIWSLKPYHQAQVIGLHSSNSTQPSCP